ncbi:MAG TPA: hypothetical protein PLM80_01790 [Mesotoga sp.]|jgi:hypothetical protein|nr:hypothetical protein [Mesotoga sp.]MDI9374306.1 hypothetical protein [Thermotogota bacterium]MDD4477827.1 hypothetical protein [Mesotoga sp.]MDD5744027.1 hypothetical protein [Mesotoga sp.]HOI62676.1 hypothetical protein [Mesotoga sp.]
MDEKDQGGGSLSLLYNSMYLTSSFRIIARRAAVDLEKFEKHI